MKSTLAIAYFVLYSTLLSANNVQQNKINQQSQPYSTDEFASLALEEDTTITCRQELKGLTVVGEKEGKSILELPASGTQVSSRGLVVSKINNIKDLALTIPNMFMPDYGTKLTSPVYIRGIGSRINSPSIGLYVDGIPYLEKSAFDFDFADISSVEVLRGPQGTLYGRNTMGGIINVTTKSPFSNSGTSINLGGGNYGRLQASLSDYRALSDKFGYGVAGYFQHNSGYFYNETLDEYADMLNSGGGRIKLGYREGRHQLNFIVNGEYSYQNGYPYKRLDADTKEAQPVDYDRASLYKRTMLSAGLNYIYTAPKVTLTSRSAFQYTKDHQGIDQDFSPDNLYYINQREEQNAFSQELELKPTNAKRVYWIVGASAFYQSFNSGVVMEVVQQNISTDKRYDTPRYGGALYGQAIIDDLLLKNLSLTAGVRLDAESAKLNYNYYMVAKGNSKLMDDFTNTLNYNQISPKLSLQYKINGYGQLYATVTKGYKAGGFNSSFVTDDESSFKPEHSWNYEAGTKFSLAENRVVGSFAAFYIDWRDQQVYQLISTGTGSLLKNAARSYSKGIEVSLNYRPINYLNLGVDYGYTAAHFLEYVASNGSDYSGNRLPYVPQNTLSLKGDYTLYIKGARFLDSINFSAQYNGVGDIYWSDANALSQKYYSLVNSRIALTCNNFTISLWAKNITNTKYNAFYFEALGNSYVQEGRPFTLGVDLEINF